MAKFKLHTPIVPDVPATTLFSTNHHATGDPCFVTRNCAQFFLHVCHFIFLSFLNTSSLDISSLNASAQWSMMTFLLDIIMCSLLPAPQFFSIDTLSHYRESSTRSVFFSHHLSNHGSLLVIRKEFSASPLNFYLLTEVCNDVKLPFHHHMIRLFVSFA